jgi:integrase
MARGKRTTLATGIYADQAGITVRVQKGSGKTAVILESPRFPLGTPLEELRQVRRDLKDQLGDADPDHQANTLGIAFDAYLDTFPKGSARRRDESALLEHWRAAGWEARAIGAVTSLDIRQQLATWSGKFQPATINHLRRVLGAVYRAVNGKSGFNPVRDVPKLTVRYEDPRAIPYDVIEFIFSHMPDIGQPVKGRKGRPSVSGTKVDLRTMAYTGLPPAQLNRLQPRDLNLRAQQVFGRPRRKGAGVDGYPLALTAAGVRELRQFEKHQRFGKVRARTAARTWRRAVTRAKATWTKEKRAPWPLPDDIRPYDLRHSFLSSIMAASGDLQATADLGMHASLSTTRRYTKATVSPRMRAAVERVNAILPHGSVHGSARKQGRK